MKLQVELKRLLDPYVHRVGASILRKDLPPLHDNLVLLQPSPVQAKILKHRQKLKNNKEKSNNFFR
jgi:hypothetical protein